MKKILVALLFIPLALFGSITSQTDRSGLFTVSALPQTIPTGMNFQQGSDLLVLDLGTTGTPNDPAITLTLGSDYNVSGGSYNGANQMQTGSITVVSTGSHSVAVGHRIVVMRNVPINQTSSFATSGPLTIQQIEQALDKQATLSQQVNEVTGRSLQFENFETASPVLSLASRKGKVLGFNSSTGAIEFVTNGGGGGGGGGSGTVTSVSVTTANGVSGTVANSTTTPAITLSLGAITPSSVVASGTGTFSGLTAFDAAGPYIYAQSNFTGGMPTFSAINNGSATLSLILNGSAVAGTTFGVSNANLGLLLANAAGGTYPSAIAIGTSNNTPVVFGVNGSEVGRFTSTGLNNAAVGATTPSTGAFTTLSATTPVGVASGGTGANSLTANNVLLGNGTSAVQVVPPGSSGNILTSNGTTWASAAAPSGTIPSQTGNAGKFLTTDGTTASWAPATGTGTVTSVSVTTANGVSGSVATSTTTPAITLTLGAINPTSIGATTPGSGAFTTLTASTPMAGASGGTGVSNSGKTITLGGNLTTSGAFSTTLTSTATTTVTLPTTGTLSTLAGTEALSNKTITASAFNGTIGATTASTGAFTGIGVGVTSQAGAGITVASAITASSGNAIGIANNPDLTAGANSDNLYHVSTGFGTVAKGSFTGLTLYGQRIANPSVTGAGTIANQYSLYIDAPTRATTNYGVYVAGGLNFFGDNTALAAGKYLNWGTTYGTSGYGIRDNAGTMEYKNSGGGWAGIGSGGGSSDYLSTLTNTEVAITTTATATISKQHLVSGTTSDYTIALPAASGNAGKYLSFRISPTATKLFTIDGNASETIDGALTRIMHNGETATLYCDGSNWFKIAGKSIPFYVEVNYPFDGSGLNGMAITGNAFTKALPNTVVSDANALWDTTNKWVTLPRPGRYQFDSLFRIEHGVGVTNYGIGVNSALADTTSFTWQNTNSGAGTFNRNGAANRRTYEASSAGGQFFLYYYFDGSSPSQTAQVQFVMQEINIW